jgi:16S rRNA (uracil1498-N3)-methyltransferase
VGASSGFAAADGAPVHVVLPPGSGVAPGADVTLDGAEAHHLVRVRRVRLGERVTVADGQGTWWPTEVAGRTPDVLTLQACGPPVREPQLVPPLTVAFALGSGDQPARVVAACTELGADRFLPWAAARGVVRPDAARAASLVDRLARVARAAAAQSRRAQVPVVEPVGTIDEVAQRPGLLLGSPGGPPPGPELRAEGSWCLVTGPEGGLTAAETERLGGATVVGLGPFVLRCATAPVAGTAALGALRQLGWARAPRGGEILDTAGRVVR